jgi:hypothetical protein
LFSKAEQNHWHFVKQQCSLQGMLPQTKDHSPASAHGCILRVPLRLVCLHRMRRVSSALKRAMWRCTYGNESTYAQQ